VDESLVSQTVALRSCRDDLDVIEFGRVFGQPLDGKLMLTHFEGVAGQLADVDRPIVLDEHNWFHRSSGLGPYKWSSCSR